MITSFKQQEQASLIHSSWVFLGIAFVLMLFSCVKKEPDNRPEGWPKTLKVAYLPDEETPGRRASMYDGLKKYLEKELGVQVRFHKITIYGPVIEAMRSGKIDIAFLNSFSYIIGHEKGGIESLVMRAKPDGSPSGYHSILITSADSQVHDIDDLQAKAAELVFSFVNPASTSGHLVPRSMLSNIGIRPEKDFREVVYSGSQSATIHSVLNGSADVAGVSSANFAKMLTNESIEHDQFRILWKSPVIPAGCTTVRKELPKSLKNALRQAYLNIEERDPDLHRELLDVYREYLEMGAEPGGFIDCPDSIFDPLRELVTRIQSE